MSVQARTGPVLSLAGLNKSYGALQATRDVALGVAAGEIHALIGPNGAGKTTLVRQIYGSEAPDSGSIRLRGEEIGHLSVPQRVRQGIGRSFQISNVLADFTVIENAVIASGTPDEIAGDAAVRAAYLGSDDDAAA